MKQDRHSSIHPIRVALLVCAAAYAAASFGDMAKRRPHRPAQPSGGLVYTAAEARHICVVDAQRTIPRAGLRRAVDAVLVHLHMPFAIEAADGSESAEAAVRRVVKDGRAGVVLAFVDGEIDRQGWLAEDAATGAWLVNVAALGRGANRGVLAERVRKMLWRSLGRALGLDEGGGPASVLDRARTLAELDAIKAPTPSPMQHNAMVDRLEKRGVKMVKVGTYRTACQQGWAPEPTNDVQRAIWEQVRSEKERGPVNGIRIAPPNAKR